jgi:hypothetical protein
MFDLAFELLSAAEVYIHNMVRWKSRVKIGTGKIIVEARGNRRLYISQWRILFPFLQHPNRKNNIIRVTHLATRDTSSGTP